MGWNPGNWGGQSMRLTRCVSLKAHQILIYVQIICTFAASCCLNEECPMWQCYKLKRTFSTPNLPKIATFRPFFRLHDLHSPVRRIYTRSNWLELYVHNYYRLPQLPYQSVKTMYFFYFFCNNYTFMLTYPTFSLWRFYLAYKLCLFLCKHY